MMLKLLEQQQHMFAAHMARSNSILTTFGDGIDSLRKATLKSAEAAERHTTHAQQAHDKKGPSNNRLPKFHAKSDESFPDWYEDVLSILALKEWSPLFDKSTNDVYTTTTPTTAQLRIFSQ